MKATILIAGPTASGKSRLALALAERLGDRGARIINADSMQVYAELRVLSARPTPADEARAPHRLYGVLPARTPCSAGRWRDLALGEIAAAHRHGAVAIVVGGTGLYFHALLQGIAPVPDIPGGVRAEARARIAAPGGGAALLADLVAADPASARLAGDPQRIARAWEVLAATGEPLAAWQRRDPGPVLGGPMARLLLRPDRAARNAAIDARVAAMAAQGAVAEAEALAALALDPGLPVQRAVGVREFAAVARRQISIAEGVARAQQASRRYAKRQSTWFRSRMDDWTPVPASSDAQFMESFDERIFPIIRDFLLTGPD